MKTQTTAEKEVDVHKGEKDVAKNEKQMYQEITDALFHNSGSSSWKHYVYDESKHSEPAYIIYI